MRIFQNFNSRYKFVDQPGQSRITTRTARVRSMVLAGYVVGFMYLLTPGHRYSEKSRAYIDFFEENIKKPGVIECPSGLQYRILREGYGSKPTSKGKVSVHCEGTLLDGTMFTTTEGGKPIEFNLDQVIPGFAEGLSKMKVGAEYELYIPSQLGYGRTGKIGSVPPNEALIFRVQMVSVH